MSKKRWTTSNKAVYNIGYHLIWCPKYRRKVLVGDVEVRLRELFLERANGHISEDTIRKYIDDQKGV